MSSVVQGFSKSLAMTVLSEIGDKTFFAAAILAMRHPRRLVLSGCLASLIVMTILSAVVGWAAPNLISRKWTHHITTVLFFGFGLWSLWDGFMENGEAEELAEVEAKLDADWNPTSNTASASASTATVSIILSGKVTIFPTIITLPRSTCYLSYTPWQNAPSHRNHNKNRRHAPPPLRRSFLLMGQPPVAVTSTAWVLPPLPREAVKSTDSPR